MDTMAHVLSTGYIKMRFYNCVYLNSLIMCSFFYLRWSPVTHFHIMMWIWSIFCYNNHACRGYNFVLKGSYQKRGFQQRHCRVSLPSRCCIFSRVFSNVASWLSRWFAICPLSFIASLVSARCSFMLVKMTQIFRHFDAFSVVFEQHALSNKRQLIMSMLS